jgi:predicted porin
MNKKLMAVAVAGAFVTPAVALAQNSTVQIYGKVTAEYGYADQGSGRPNTDIFQTPGGANVGFKGEEKLGGGLSAWFQCESSADVRGMNCDGFCTRNSAIGLKGGFGNLHFGRWDTPFKRAGATGTIGSLETGLFGSSFLFSGNSTGTIATGGVSLGRNIWKRREASEIYYESPVFSGFQVLASFSAANATAALDTTTNAKPRVTSIAGTYNNGPLNIGLAYEKHTDFGNGSVGTAAVASKAGSAAFPNQFIAGGTNVITAFTQPVNAAGATAGTGGDDRGWTVGANYTFAGQFQVGVQYIDTKYDMGNGQDLKKQNWHLGADWNFSGPHHVMGSYVDAGNSKGSYVGTAGAAVPGMTGNGAIAAPNILVGGVITPNAGTGGKFWTLAYQYDFSKRTLVRVGYSKVDNDTGAIYSLGGLTTPTGTAVGTSQSAWIMYTEHKF